MDLFNFDTVKAEKANAMNKYRSIRKIAKFFRLFEVILVLIFISWFCTQLPSAIHISGKFFKQLSVILVSPCFVFLLGNAIILTLFLNSRTFSGNTNNTGSSNLYDEFLKNSESRHKICADTATKTVEEIMYEDKQVVNEEISIPKMKSSMEKKSEKKISRSRSDNMKREFNEKPGRELRRTITSEKCKKVENLEEEEGRDWMDEESNEEFQRKIEAFIAKQVKFHKEESMAIVLRNES